MVAVLVLQLCGLALTQLLLLLLLLHGVVWMLLVWVVAGVVLALGVGRPVGMVVRLAGAQGGELAVGMVAWLLQRGVGHGRLDEMVRRGVDGHAHALRGC